MTASCWLAPARSAWLLVYWCVILQLACVRAKESCPNQCSCSSGLKRVSCINQKLTEIPAELPVNVTELYLSSNKLTVLSPSSFSTLVNLKTLGLNNNIIRQIEPGAFRGLSGLHQLYLTQNELLDFPTTVSHDLTGLQNLYLGNNKLTNIPEFPGMVGLKYIDLSGNQFRNLSFAESYEKLKNLTTVILSNSVLGDSNLTPATFHSLRESKLSKLSLSRCNVKTTENGTFAMFTKLTSLDIGHNEQLDTASLQALIGDLRNSPNLAALTLSGSVSALPQDLFKPLKKSKLQTLNMAQCDFKSIPANLFAYISGLSHLDLSYNTHLTSIDDLAFMDVMSLQTLYLDHCNLEDVPNNLPTSLQTLILQGNTQITVLPGNRFGLNSNLASLDLSLCKIRSVTKNAFTGLVRLKILDLSGNALSDTSLAADLSNLNSLTTLKLQNNNIKSIPTDKDLFQGLTSLQLLDMSNNQCGHLHPEIFHNLRNLTYLNLARNQMGNDIQSDTSGQLFQDLTGLVRLDLNDNDLSIVRQATFQSLRVLSNLNLSRNFISSWENGAFSPLQNLSTLDLSFNQIAVINESSVGGLTAGLSLNLSSNPFTCWCDNIWFRNWVNNASVSLTNLDGYTCASPSTYDGKRLLDFDPATISDKCRPPFWKYALYAGAGAAVLVTVLSLVLYRTRWRIFGVYYRLKYNKARTNPEAAPLLEPASNTHYNVTILYGPDNDSVEWVRDRLVPWLREKNLNAFTEEDVLPGTGLGEQFRLLDEASRQSSTIILICTTKGIDDGRKQLEMDFVVRSIFDSMENQPTAKQLVLVYFLRPQQNTELQVARLMDRLPRTVDRLARRDNGAEPLICALHNNERMEVFWQRLELRLQ